MDSLVVCKCGHSITSHADAGQHIGCLENRCRCRLRPRSVLDAACAQVRTEWHEQWRARPLADG